MPTSRNSSSGASVTESELPEPDGEQVEADDERGNRRARDERHVRPHAHHPVGVLDHAAPVGIGGRQPDAEEAEDADDDDVVAGAQTHVDDQRAAGIRQDLDQHDVERRLAPYLGRRHVLALAQLQGHSADDARDDRRLRQREHADDIPGRRAEGGQDDHVEDDHRKREHDVAGPGEHEIDPAPVVSGGEAEQAAERRRAEDGEWGDDEDGARAPREADGRAAVAGAVRAEARMGGWRTMWARSPRMLGARATKTATSAPASTSAMSLKSAASSIMRPKPG